MDAVIWWSGDIETLIEREKEVNKLLGERGEQMQSIVSKEH